MADYLAHPYNQRESMLCAGIIDFFLIRCDVGQVVTTDVFPDDVLLAISDFYVFVYQNLILLVARGGYDTKREIDS